MQKVLVLYYSQTGQLKAIIDSVLEPVAGRADMRVTCAEIKPKRAYPFPWTAYQFCDVFPESFAGTPCELLPLGCDPDEHYDLVILAYTVWYLSPSIPIASFLQSPEAEKIINGRPVITLIGCRNMWLLAQERVKKILQELGGRLIGNIVLRDRANNLVGVLTIAVWMLTGKKDRFMRVFPRPGISEEDIRGARRFGGFIQKALAGRPVDMDQSELNAAGAVHVDPALVLMEKRVAKVFKIWSAFIRQKGEIGNPNRRLRVRAFMVYLIAAVIFLAPLAAVAAGLLRRIKKDRLAAETAYYSQNTLS
jgi:hypothetical protein